jgi:multidrug efflux pump
MSLSTPFIHRPVGTTLLTIAVALAGALAYLFLPVSPLPQVDFPTIQVRPPARRQPRDDGVGGRHAAGAAVRAHRRHHGDDLEQLRWARRPITMQFDLNRNIDAAARDVQAAINAAAGSCRPTCPAIRPTARSTRPTRRS